MKLTALPNAATLFRCLPRWLRRHRLITAWMGMSGEDPFQLVPIVDGISGFADLREGFLRLILIEGGFESEFFKLAKAIFPPDGTFFDVGANFGLMTVGMAGAVAPAGSYHLFEPNPGLSPIIKRSLSRLNAVSAHINASAVSDCAGPVMMQFISSHTGASHVSISGTSVSTLRLDDYVRDESIQRIDLMKIDVEGYEASVLKSMPKSLESGVVRVIYFEYVRKWIGRYGDPDEVLDLLDGSGFRVFYCREHDLCAGSAAVKSLRIAGASTLVDVIEVDRGMPPAETDLLAVHRSALLGFGV